MQTSSSSMATSLLAIAGQTATPPGATASLNSVEAGGKTLFSNIIAALSSSQGEATEAGEQAHLAGLTLAAQAANGKAAAKPGKILPDTAKGLPVLEGLPSAPHNLLPTANGSTTSITLAAEPACEEAHATCDPIAAPATLARIAETQDGAAAMLQPEDGALPGQNIALSSDTPDDSAAVSTVSMPQVAAAPPTTNLLPSPDAEMAKGDHAAPSMRAWAAPDAAQQPTAQPRGPANTQTGPAPMQPVSITLAPAEAPTTADKLATVPVAAKVLEVMQQRASQSAGPDAQAGDQPKGDASSELRTLRPAPNAAAQAQPANTAAPTLPLAADTTQLTAQTAQTPVPSAAKAPTMADPVQDIDALLDRLAAARSLSQPAQAKIAIEHSDFGAIDLRFSHHRSGALAVELSSQDPELRAALAGSLSSQSTGAVQANATASTSTTATGQDASQAAMRGSGQERDASGQSGRGASDHRQRDDAQARHSQQNGDPQGGRTRQGDYQRGLLA